MNDTEVMVRAEEAIDILGIPKQSRESGAGIYLEVKATDIYKKLAEEEISRERASLQRYQQALQTLADARVQLTMQLASVGEQFRSVETMVEITHAKLNACENLLSNPHKGEGKGKGGEIQSNERKENAILKAFYAENPEQPDTAVLSPLRISKHIGGNNSPQQISCWLTYQSRFGGLNYFQKSRERRPEDPSSRVFWRMTPKGYNELINII